MSYVALQSFETASIFQANNEIIGHRLIDWHCRRSGDDAIRIGNAQVRERLVSQFDELGYLTYG
jgi:hypothetical protein